MGYSFAIIRFHISVFHHSFQIECAVVRRGELYLIAAPEQIPRVAGTGTASHGVQAFIGLLLKSGILVQILFVFHDDFPFFCGIFSSAIVNDQLRS